MSNRYNVASPREYEDRDGNRKTSWVNLGVAFEKDGKITVLLNAAPFPGPDGQAKLILMEPREDDDRGGYGNGNGRRDDRGQNNARNENNNRGGYSGGNRGGGNW